ncbi:MAG: mechanosensitive ion channel family protein [Actinomycetota bacterium]
MDEFRDGLGDAWASVAAFIPKFIAFLLILVIGYFVAKAIAKGVDAVLERVGFDRAVERGGIRRALAHSQYDASGLLGKLTFYVIMLFVLQLAFGMFGPNPVSELITGVVAYLPNIFAAVLIVVIGSAIAAAVKEILEASLGGLSYGRGLAIGASIAILVVTVFAALDQLNIAENIVTGLFYAILAIVVGSSVVAIGGGGIKTMQRYWDRAADRADRESSNLRSEMGGAGERIRRRAEQRSQEVGAGTPAEGTQPAAQTTQTSGAYEEPTTVRSGEQQPPRR